MGFLTSKLKEKLDELFFFFWFNFQFEITEARAFSEEVMDITILTNTINQTLVSIDLVELKAGMKLS